MPMRKALLLPQYQDFGLQPPPRLEAVAQHADEKGRQLQSRDDHALIRRWPRVKWMEFSEATTLQ
jgi:hypothetical protein